jgi:F-type H+-transporting ATPase subunit delta
MISPTVVKRYASALADVVVAPNSELAPAEAVAQLHTFYVSASAVPELQAVLASPAVPAARKRTVIRAIAGALGLQRILVNFLLVLSDRRRWEALRDVIDSLDAILDNYLGFERVEVHSAYELSDAQRDELSRELSRIVSDQAVGRKIRLCLAVEPDLIGGVTARLGSTVYDGSVRGQLAKMRRNLAANRY